MTVSVVMPVLNGGFILLEALASVAGQTLPVTELIVIDDASTDGTADRAAAAAAVLGLPLTVLRNERNMGIARSLDTGVRASTCDLVLRLDADDRWLPDHVQTLVDMASADPAAVLFSSRVRLVDVQKRMLGESPVLDGDDLRWKLAWDNPLTHSASGFRRQAYHAAGGYRATYRWEDYDLWIRLLTIGDMGFSNAITMEYTVAATSLSRVGRRGMADRLALQRRAVRAFVGRHPVRVMTLAPAIMMRSLIEILRP